MSQYARTVLNPAVHGGIFLATMLNGWTDAVETSHQGASRPSYAQSGMLWAKTVSSTIVQLYYFDGADDVLLGTVNPTANTFVPAGVSSGVPPGAMMDYAGAAAPSGWLFCNGQLVSRATYADLFTAISTTYGVGDGSTTFALPDCRGRVVAGPDNMGGVGAAGRLTNAVMAPDGTTVGAVGGSQTHTLSTPEIPSHNHVVSKKNTSTAGAGQNLMASTSTGTDASANTASTGGGGAHNNTQPTILLNKIIKT